MFYIYLCVDWFLLICMLQFLKNKIIKELLTLIAFYKCFPPKLAKNKKKKVELYHTLFSWKKKELKLSELDTNAEFQQN